jgi:hypothetical protein
MKFITLVFIYSVFLVNQAYSQSLVEDANLDDSNSMGETFFNETIKIISSSKKIFILTNNSQQLGMGDFISLAMENNLAARAVVVKTHQEKVGIKILKIYSLNQWGKLRRNQEVQIIKGDDSQFGKPKVELKTDSSIAKIKSEEDLFSSDVVVSDEVGDFEENKNRHIKPDNLVAISGAFYDAAEIESRGGIVRTNEFGASWGFQFSDNYFIEGLYGRSILDNYPGDGSQTLVNHLTARLKFNIRGPIYTFFMPYVGFHSYTVSSPDAGKTNNNAINDEELRATDSLKKSGPIFGVTVLRRLVPGWFIKGDLGSDIINLGFAIEF